MVPDLLRRTLLAAGPLPNSSAGFHDGVCAALSRAGWAVEREFRVEAVPGRGGPRSGRVDLVARKGDAAVAVELDRLSPRRKSLAKLRASGFGHRVVILRRPCAPLEVDGVTVFGLEVIQ